MEIDGSETQRPGKTRQRHLMRRRKQGQMSHVSKREFPFTFNAGISEWRARITKPSMLKIAGFAAAYLLTGRIFPNVWSLGVPLGSISPQEAATQLLDTWHNQVQIELVDGDRTWTETPTELGLRLDAQLTAERARGVGLAGIPFGYSVEPTVSLNSETAQSFLTSMANQVNIAPYNAGYEWQDDQLVGVPGREGRTRDVAQTLERLAQNRVVVVGRQRLARSSLVLDFGKIQNSVNHVFVSRLPFRIPSISLRLPPCPNAGEAGRGCCFGNIAFQIIL